ncbi:MAG TPA: hypothetical protein G4N96_00300 [Chloroflexi bacterium]|nr:hypothetical protein [Chloroflexota bacterium]
MHCTYSVRRTEQPWACAQEGNADYIVSGDQDLLVLEAYRGIRVVTPQAFTEILAQQD